MSSVSLLGDTSGSVLLQAPAVAGSTTINIAAQSGTLNVGGPAFYAYQANSQTISSGANTKVTLDGELFDTNNCFASSRFTPNVAGYYHLSATVFVASSAQEIVTIIYKNGAGYSTGMDVTSNAYNSTVTTLAYANGTTDYFEVYLYLSTTRAVSANSQNTYFTGFLARGA